MQPVRYLPVLDESAALEAATTPRRAFLAGGTSLVDLMKLDVERPDTLVDIGALPLARIDAVEGGVLVGALARNSDVAWDGTIRARYPMLSEALLSGASPQLRNMATVGGNLLQRTRCPYFRDVATRCNKRAPGSGCDAMDGVNRMHAVLGTSARCIAAHPSDMCVALAALDAVVVSRGARGERRTPIVDFHLLPGDHPEREHVLDPGELVTHVFLPDPPAAAKSVYLKVRDRAEYAFALVSVAALLAVDAGGAVRAARIALGGVGTKPWRARDAEQSLVGSRADGAAVREAAALAVRGATPRAENAFKVELAKRTIARALGLVGAAS